jgi:endoglucanase
MAYTHKAEALFAVPTAPYKEMWLRERLEQMLARIPGVVVERDRWGNVFARLRRGDPPPGTVCFVAHMDHPGFVVHRVDGPAVHATFEGNVDDAFMAGAGVRLFRSSNDDGVAAQVVEFTERDPASHSRRVVLEAAADARGAVLGMWDLRPYEVDDHNVLHSRGIDDIGGVTAIVDALDHAAARTEPVDMIGMFTRAEECGYRGALLFCEMDPAERARHLPADAWVVSVETSSARPNTPIGGGAVLRVGDKSTIFNPRITRTMQEISEDLRDRLGILPPQRALMDGGTCEATVFNHFGYTSGGLCVPLGNYHNMNRDTNEIDREFISVNDAEALVRLMTELAIQGRSADLGPSRLERELATLAADARPKMFDWPKG